MQRRLFVATLMLVFLITLLAVGQTLQVVPPGELQAKRDAYGRRFEAWRQADADLEKEIMRLPADRALRRIELANLRAREFQQASAEYYGAVVVRIRSQIELLNAPVTSGLGESSAALREGASQKLEQLGTSLPDLDLERLGLSEDDPRRTLIAEQVDRQRQAQEQLRANLEQQIQAFEQAGAAARALDESRRQIRRSYEMLLEVFANEQGRVEQETTLWENYYASLRELVAERAASGSRNSNSGKRKKDTARP